MYHIKEKLVEPIKLKTYPHDSLYYIEKNKEN